MSEYWVSKKKYFCKYCDIYIADDAPSRQQHENGLRHKGNRERYIRGIYKSGEKKKQELAEEKREMARVEAAANAAYAQDIGSGIAGPSKYSTAPTPAPKPKKPVKPSDPYANYSNAAQLGFVDVEGEHMEALKALKEKEGRIAEPEPEPEPTPDEEERRWKFESNKRRRISVAMGDIYDPGEISVLRKEGEVKDEPTEEPKIEPQDQSLPKPAWKPIVLKKTTNAGVTPLEHKGAEKSEEISETVPPVPILDVTSTQSPIPNPPTEPQVELPFISPPVKLEAKEPSVQEEESKPTSAGLFRKRKAPSTTVSNTTRGTRRML
ncbi:uncharacterized protein EI90DRAFT_3011806 [Cantharellus anzutake]|uniref:uncharacterized protein n=1 Tax=Cantharellus anzutake TaxID=1750568 RepID=UPI0019030488|nr:uncharacterized protein EI90DRAFT_3011806 [Cantharellus anzutake]KAF8342308.1 hypothetical protein EI90DRAFT_3011806 [Cantharellus anzutake]